MNVTLYRIEVDDDTFPEMRPPSRERGIRHRMLEGLSEPRLPPAAAAVKHLLLVVFRLGADTGSTEWSLSFDVSDAEGRLRSVRQVLLDEPMDGNATERPAGHLSAPMPPGLIYRGAFWVNLDPLVKACALRGGSVMKLRYGLGEPVSVVLPG